MALRKIKLGELLEQSDERNTKEAFGLDSIRGISTQKVFIDTKANMDGVSLKGYKIVPPNCFSYVPDTSRRGEKISIAFNNSKETYLVSSISIVFKVKSELIDPWYLFMFFNRPEFDRYSRYHSFGSAREPFNWEDMCGIEIELPDLKTQKRFVNVYLGMLENQKAYETGLGDLKLVCDGYIDYLKNKNQKVKIGRFIEQIDNRNEHNFTFKFAGLSMDNYFIDSIADSNELDFSNYKIVRPNEYGAVLMKVGRDCRLTIARNTGNENLLISPAYFTFVTHDINPEYFMANVNRSEFERRGWFFCDSSARGSLSWELFLELEIPVASASEQNIVSELYKVAMLRSEINQRLKKQIKNICPVLIKGSIEEAKEA